MVVQFTEAAPGQAIDRHLPGDHRRRLMSEQATELSAQKLIATDNLIFFSFPFWLYLYVSFFSIDFCKNLSSTWEQAVLMAIPNLCLP